MIARLESQADGWRHYRVHSGLYGYTASESLTERRFLIWSRGDGRRIDPAGDDGRAIVLACQQALKAQVAA